MRARIHFLIALCLACWSLRAQETAPPDTLPPALKTDIRAVKSGLGMQKTDAGFIRSIVSPLGEGDPIRWTQTLPGVTGGADGSSAYYVRGGNMGNNLISLDGVPVYGYSHLLGLTTVIPQGIQDEITLVKGGFDGGKSNFTASHLRVTTRKPRQERHRFHGALNNFLAEAGAEGPMGKNSSYMLSARISPLTLEYRAVKKTLPDLFSSLEDFRAGVADVYGKIHWQTGESGQVDAWGLFSTDSYAFVTPDKSEEMMGWNNLLAAVRYSYEKGPTSARVHAYMSRFVSSQRQYADYRGLAQELSLRSRLTEAALHAVAGHHLGERFSLEEGLNLRLGLFAPGQIGAVNTLTPTLLATAHLQGVYAIPSVLSMRLGVNGNLFFNFNGGRYFAPDMNFSLKWMLSPVFSLEATADRMTQFYHTLEGLPIGWSLDMIVPSGKKAAPESVWQASLGALLSMKSHSLQAGVFYKSMDGLTYYKNAQFLFNGGMASWEEDVDMGKGKSYGMELQYEYHGKVFQAHAAYTLSRSTREGFASIAGGAPFHARFDRLHVLNVTAQIYGLSASLTYQSGHWENAAAEEYLIGILGQTLTARYFSGVNNFQMPDVFRLDLGYRFGFVTGPVKHDLNLGVSNVTNHFNPFLLYYDTSTRGWKQLALLPILPNFSWRVSF